MTENDGCMRAHVPDVDFNTFKNMKNSIIVVNYKTGKWIPDCLSSIFKQISMNETEVILLDNNSGDIDPRILSEFRGLKIIHLNKNLGFAEANNLGVIKSKAKKYLIFVNPDTKAEDEWFENLIKAADKNKEYQILCSIQSAYPKSNKPKVLNMVGEVTDGPESSEDITDSLFASGACFLIRREWLDRLGYLFDPFYFCFAEDLELSLRTIFMGGKIGYVKNSRIWHNVRGSGYSSTWSANLAMRNSLSTYYKLFETINFVRIFIAKILYTILRLCFRFRYTKANYGMVKGVFEFLKGFRNYESFKRDFKTRKVLNDKFVLSNFLYAHRITKLLIKKGLYGC